MTQKTIAQILHSAKPGDKLTDGKRQWIVEEFDGIHIGIPSNKNDDIFEIWETGVEKYAVLPGLKRVKARKSLKGEKR